MIRTIPDGREVVITELPDEPFPGLAIFRALFAGSDVTDPGPRGYGDTPGEAVTDLLCSEWQHKREGQRKARKLAGIGDESDLPAGYRHYVHHIDGNPRNNDPDNLVVVRGDGR
jgi:hypothetical protein